MISIMILILSYIINPLETSDLDGKLNMEFVHDSLQNCYKILRNISSLLYA